MKKFVASIAAFAVSVGLCGASVAAEKYAGDLENVPPSGFTTVFNGKDLSGWRGLAHFDPRKIKEMSEADATAFWKKNWDDAVQHWSVQDGDLVNDGHGVYLTTEKDYANYEFLIDYKTVAKADSGIY